MAPVQAKTNFWNIDIMGVVRLLAVIIGVLVFVFTIKAQVDQNTIDLQRQAPVLERLVTVLADLNNKVGQLNVHLSNQSIRLDKLEGNVQKHHDSDKIKSYEDVLRLYNNRSK